MFAVMSALRADFLRYVAQTSAEPMGIEVARSHGCTVVARDGKEYLDLLSGIGVCGIGHTHPAVVAAVTAQAGRYLHAMVYGEYVQEPQVALARKLAQIAPGDLSVTYFTNSGTEAVEGALKTARKYTGRPGLVGFAGSFHGDTFGAVSVGGNPVYRRPFAPLLPDVTLLPFNDPATLERIDASVAAVIVEPIQAEAGVRIPDDGFLPGLRRRCSEVGALLVFDEVVTGFGRTGAPFACEHWDATPDLLVVAKALGGGMPLGGFVGTPRVMDTLSHDPPLAHVTTFGGHPVCCAAGLAALDVLVGQDLVRAAYDKGAAFLAQLDGLVGTGGCTAVRGRGLLIGMEFDSPRRTQHFVQGCFAQGLIVGWTLHDDCVVRLAPPMVISAAEMDRAVSTMQQVLTRG